MKSTPLLATFVTLLTVLYDGTYGSGILAIDYKYFDSKGRDSNGDSCDIPGDCDPIFEICLRYGHGSLSAIFDCASNGTVSPQIYSEAYSNENIVTFGSIIGESVNPVVYITNNQFDGKFEISMVVVDQDILGTNDLIDHVIMMITAIKQTNFSSVLTFSGKRTIFVTTTALRYKFNCEPDYYGSYCTVYCVAQNNTNGRYTCDSETGAKICSVNYFGVDCDIECAARIGEYCYSHFDHNLNWYDAEAACVQWGGHLASIHSNNANNILNNIRNMERFTWIGLSDKALNAVFVWTDGTQFDFSIWSTGQPSSGSERCTHFWNNDMYWNDYTCNSNSFSTILTSYICQQKGTPPKPICDVLSVNLDSITCNLTLVLTWQPVSTNWTPIFYLIKENGSVIYNTSLSKMNFTYSTIFIPLSYLNITLSTHNIFGEYEVFCYSEILPDYEFDDSAFSISYSPAEDIFSLNLGFIKTPESSPDYVIALNTYTYFVFDYKPIGGVLNQFVLETTIDFPNYILSNETNRSSSFEIISGSPMVEILNVYMSLRIIEQCGVNLNKGTFNLTYNYTYDHYVPPPRVKCDLLRAILDSSNCSISFILTWDTISSNGSTIFYLVRENDIVIHNTTLSNVNFTYTTFFQPSTILNITLKAVNSTWESEDLCYSHTIPGYEVANESLQLDVQFNTSSIILDWALDPVSVYSVNTSIIIDYYYELSYVYHLCQTPDTPLHRTLSGNFALISHLSNYTVIDTFLLQPISVRLIEIYTNIEIVTLCGFNVNNSIIHNTVQTFEPPHVIPPTPTCTAVITDFDSLNCNATHLIQWEDSAFITAVYFNNNLTYIGTIFYTESRILLPYTYYRYTVASIDCDSLSEHGNCIHSAIPGYEFEKDVISINYLPETGDVSFRWRLTKVPESAPDYVVALKIKLDIISVIKISNSDLGSDVLFQKIEIRILSNQTSYFIPILTDSGEETIETLNISLSLQILEQCGVNLNNNMFSLTYSYNLDICEENSNADYCFKDSDNDGYPDILMYCSIFEIFCLDNCPAIYNPSQSDCNGNGIGDACDTTCVPETDQMFFYNWTCTEGGETEYVPCIQGGGNASRLCNKDGSWKEIIDTSHCISPEYEILQGNISIDSLETVVDIISKKQPATAGDIRLIVDVLNTTIAATFNVSTTERENIVNNTLKIVNVLAADSSQQLLGQSQETTNVAQMVIHIMEQQASSLALNQPTNVRLNTAENVFIETQRIDLTQDEGVVINADNIKGEKEGQTTPSVKVPIPKGIDPQKILSVSVVVIKNIANLITSFADAITVGTGGLKLSSFSDFQIVSPVIIVQLFSGNEQIIGDGTDPLVELSVPLSLSGIDLVQNYIKPTCLALNNTSSSNPQWYDGGIQNVSSNDIDSDAIVRCLPGHATPFVVLVGVGNLESQSVVLNILSYVGCSLSVICLLISLVIYLLFGRKLLKKIYHFVHFQLALSLCLLYLAFLFGVEPAYADVWLYIPCKIVTVVVEYLLLVVFLWMLMEGLVVLIMIMLPFHQFGWKHFVIFSILSWGIPLLYFSPFIPFYHHYFVSPPLGNSTSASSFTGPKFCFIHNDDSVNLVYSVTVPLALVILLNLFILITVITRCIMVIVQQKSFSKLQRGQKLSLRLLRLLIVMFPVLGFGWCFGLLAIYFNTVIFAWLFTILCAFQGILFLFFVLLIRRDIQQSIVNALNLRAVFLTMLSRISSQFSKTVTSKESRSPTKQLDISKSKQKYMIDSQFDSEVDLAILSQMYMRKEPGKAISPPTKAILPPTVEIEDLLMFYEERHWPLIDLYMREAIGNGEEGNDYLIETIADDLDKITSQFATFN